MFILQLLHSVSLQSVIVTVKIKQQRQLRQVKKSPRLSPQTHLDERRLPHSECDVDLTVCSVGDGAGKRCACEVFTLL